MNPEIIELGDLNRSSNFGGGIELLMNDKKNVSNDIKIDDLTNLENELNDLVSDTKPSSFDSNIFSPFTINEEKPVTLTFDEPSIKIVDTEPFREPTVSFSKLGESTSNTSEPKTWDGFGKFNNIPVQPDVAMPAQPQMSKEEMLREKLKILRKLEALESKGVNLSKKYNMDSSLLEMQGEYELILEEKNKQNSVKFQGNMMMAFINGIEFLNNKFDPFDIKLEGWGEQINENIQDYDEIFSELHEKYKSKAKIAPELKLLFQLAGSGIMIHMTNSMFKSSMPGMDDILRQNPDLMKQFQSAAVNSMGNTNPGFSGFMNGLMNPPSSSTYDMGGPPPPLATQGPNSIPPPINRPGNNMSRSSGPTNSSSISAALGMSHDDVFAKENIMRPDMRGPSDINDLLSGLKTKTINIQNQTNNSTISITDLKDLDGENIPKKSRRRKSDKNVINLN
jgi:hypothetical protein